MSFIKKALGKIWTPPEEKISELVIYHAELCFKAVEALAKATEEVCKIDKEQLEQCLQKVHSYEEEADRIRREIVKELAKGALPPLSREDFIRLAERMDLVADWAKEAARLISVITCENLRKALKDECFQLVALMKECSWKLYNAVLIMMNDFDKSLELVHEVEVIEEKGDDFYIKCLSKMEKNEESCIGVSGMLIEKLMETFENTLDACEEVGDIVKIIIVRALR